MVRIKTTNVVKDEEVSQVVRTVQCPLCNTYLKGVNSYTIVMKCPYCDREFKIQQDITKWTFDNDNTKVHMTLNVKSDHIEYSPGLS